ncbi:MAG: DNA primase [Candidatus Aenigmarchaeota archaeon]|nr:DNA primase [Candidatus Aenigmarchaeota archaeon]
MAKLAQNFAKYLIHARLHAKGVIERPDVIGAVFGQTEGLLGVDLDLRELQRTGRLGRIEVEVNTSKGKSYADIIIPSSLDSSETSLLAASLETIDKVGPCDAEIEISKVEDVRSQKRKYVIERAKEILRAMMDEGETDSQKLSETIREAVRAWEVSNYNGLSCGPEIQNAEEIIVVEGRADVINLLKNGIKNVVAIEGTKIPDPIVQLAKEKTVTAFLDGDRGGDLILKKLHAVADIDFVARAEEGKEVEELTKKQIFKSLRDREPVGGGEKKVVEEAEEETKEGVDDEAKRFLGSLLEDLIGTRAAYVVGNGNKILSKVPLSEIGDVASDYADIFAIVFDGKINQSIVDLALQRKVRCLVGMDYKEHVNAGSLAILVLNDFRSLEVRTE